MSDSLNILYLIFSKYFINKFKIISARIYYYEARREQSEDNLFRHFSHSSDCGSSALNLNHSGSGRCADYTSI